MKIEMEPIGYVENEVKDRKDASWENIFLIHKFKFVAVPSFSQGYESPQRPAYIMHKNL